MKQVAFLTLVLVLIVGLAGGLVPPAPTQAQDSIEITFVHIFPDERDVRRTTIEEMVASFEAANPGVTVNIVSTTDDYGAVFDGALLALNQGNPPHVIQVEDSLQQIAIDSQAFVKISEYASDEQRATVADIIEPMRNYYDITADDFWGLPWNASNPVMYFNPTMLEAAGLDPANPPQTFDAIIAACEQIMAAEIEGLEACINWPVTSWLPEQWVSMQGGLIVDNDNGRSGRATESYLDSPDMLRVFTWIEELDDAGYFTYTGTPNAFTPEGLLFISTKVAFHLSTSAGISNILNFGPLMGQFEPQVVPFPKPTADATNGITAGGAALWVLAGHPEAETQAAVDFVFHMLNTKNMKTWHQASGYLPILQSAIDELEAEGWFADNPFYFIPLQQLLDSVPTNAANAGMRVGASQAINAAVIEAMLSVVDAGEDPASALAAAKERADKAIADYNSVIGG